MYIFVVKAVSVHFCGESCVNVCFCVSVHFCGESCVNVCFCGGKTGQYGAACLSVKAV